MADPRVLFLYPGAGRAARLADARCGKAPREFFYGYLGLADRGYRVEIGDTHAQPSTALDRAIMALEILRNRFARVGWSRARVSAIRDAFASVDVALSFTDGFTLAMGLSARDLPAGTRRIGGFMGLSDLAERARPLLHGHIERTIATSLTGLDRVFFFGAADRAEAIRRYRLDPAKTSLFDFGVDTRFWSPAAEPGETTGVLAVGSDPNRDYATLLAAQTDVPITILTRLPLSPPPGRSDVTITRGSLHAAAVTDAGLRDMYRAASVVAVPLHDVWQPTGQSVTMQAMACGRPVVLTKGRGLWDPDVFVNGENCVLVPPHAAAAWTAAIETLARDSALCRRMGAAARETAVQHFDISRMDASAEMLVRTASET